MHTTHPKQVNYLCYKRQWRSVIKNVFAEYHVLAFSPWMTESTNTCHSDTSLACRLPVPQWLGLMTPSPSGLHRVSSHPAGLGSSFHSSKSTGFCRRCSSHLPAHQMSAMRAPSPQGLWTLGSHRKESRFWVFFKAATGSCTFERDAWETSTWNLV